MRISDLSADIQQLAREFERCRKLLLALGDENRQHLILEMLEHAKAIMEQLPDRSVMA